MARLQRRHAIEPWVENQMSTYDAIYAVVCQIPPGRVATYGQVAQLAHLPGQARLVGYALYRVDMQAGEIPWHRVVNARGEVSHSIRRNGTDYWQRALLEAEGIVFDARDRMALRQYLWNPLLESDRLPADPGDR